MGAKDKDCFVCDDFKAWDPLSQSGPKAAPKAGGPLTKAELGQSSWAFIHTMAAYYNPKSENHKVSLALSILQRSYALGTYFSYNSHVKSLMRSLIDGIAEFYPCSYCASHLKKYVEKNPPTLDSNILLSRWWCLVHNDVNRRLGKPRFDCDRVLERWRK